MIKINTATLEATREEIPASIRGLDNKTLRNLQSELNPVPDDLKDLEWWPEVITVQALTSLQKFGDEVLVANEDKTVSVSFEVLNKTAEEIAAELTDHRELKKAEAKEIRLARAFTGTPYDGNRFGSDENDINAIVTTAININTNFLTMAEATGGYWKSYNNGSVAMTQTEFLAMAKDVSLFLLKNKRGYHAAKVDIDAALDITAVNLIVETYRTFDPLGA